MTPEQIRKQMMGSAGIQGEDTDALFEQAHALYKSKDYCQAFSLAKRAADHGHAPACNLAGLCYAKGLGVETNLPQAKAFFQRSAKGGFPRGIRNFAMTAMDEAFGPPDYAAALKLLNEADEAGDSKAPGILALLYLEGRGVEKDLAKTVDLLNKGIDRGDEVALYNCSLCYRDGVALEKDLQKALGLAKEAHAKGYEPAENLVAEIEAEMQGKTLSRIDAALPTPAAEPTQKQPGSKSMVLAVVLAFLFGPLGLFYVSWKRALLLLLVFIVGVALIPKNGFVVLLLWLVVPLLSIIYLGVGKRQPPPA